MFHSSADRIVVFVNHAHRATSLLAFAGRRHANRRTVGDRPLWPARVPPSRHQSRMGWATGQLRLVVATGMLASIARGGRVRARTALAAAAGESQLLVITGPLGLAGPANLHQHCELLVASISLTVHFETSLAFSAAPTAW